LNFEALYANRAGLPQVDVQAASTTSDLTFEVTPGTSVHAAFDAVGFRYRAGTLVNSAQLPGEALAPPDVTLPLEGEPTGLPKAPDASLQAVGLLAAEGLQTLRLDYWTWHTGAGLVHEFSPRTSVTVDLGYRRTYQEPRTYAEGEQLEAQAALRQVLDTTANLSLAYDYQDNRFQIGVRTHTFVTQAQKEFGQKVTADASLGASYYDGADPTLSGWRVVGGAGVSLRLKHTRLVARYTHTRYQGLVTGRNELTDLAFASLSHRLGRRLSATIYGYYRDARDPLATLFSYDTAAAGATLTARIKKRSDTGFSYLFQHFRASPAPAADRSLLTFFVGYTYASK
jgi:hypothetical protein